jgi:hypothetical protein
MNTEKKWKFFRGGDCPHCGDDLEVLSVCLTENDTEFEIFVMDDEDVRCSGSCGFESSVIADGEFTTIQEGNLEELEKESNS